MLVLILLLIIIILLFSSDIQIYFCNQSDLNLIINYKMSEVPLNFMKDENIAKEDNAEDDNIFARNNKILGSIRILGKLNYIS